MRSDREERGERGKINKTSRSGSRTHCRSVLNQLSGSYSRCHAMVLDIFGGRLDTPPPPGGRRWLLQSRAAGSESRAWSSLVFHCRHSSFNPSEAPPWDSRPESGAGVIHYHLLHRPRSVPTALGPAPLATIT